VAAEYAARNRLQWDQHDGSDRKLKLQNRGMGISLSLKVHYRKKQMVSVSKTHFGEETYISICRLHSNYARVTALRVDSLGLIS
jgi:hypothetical protein